MNTTAINNLAAFLENIPSRYNRGFNMETYISDWEEEDHTNVGFQCNSTACIAGWACLVLGAKGGILKKERDSHGINSFAHTARDLLGLDERTSDELFEPFNHRFLARDDIDWDKVTPRQAAKVLRHLAKTSEVDWNVGLAA